MMQQKIINDSIQLSGINSTDSIQLVNDNLLLMQTIAHLSQQENLLLSQYNNNKAGKIRSAIALNNAINTTATIETNEQDINDIYLTKIVVGDYLLTAAQLNTLHYVANQCPFAGGRAVFLARAILKLIGDSIVYDDAGVCAALGFYRKANKNLTNNNPQLRAIPNPANDFCTVYYELTKDISAIIYIYDSYGKLVIQNPLVLNSTSHKIDVNKLQDGIYNFIIKSNSIEVGKGKFCIIR